MKLAKATGGGDHTDPVPDDPVDAFFKGIDINRVRAMNRAAIRGGKGGHHPHHTLQI